VVELPQVVPLKSTVILVLCRLRPQIFEQLVHPRDLAFLPESTGQIDARKMEQPLNLALFLDGPLPLRARLYEGRL
jgi:hypothetical protein